MILDNYDLDEYRRYGEKCILKIEKTKDERLSNMRYLFALYKDNYFHAMVGAAGGKIAINTNHFLEVRHVNSYENQHKNVARANAAYHHMMSNPVDRFVRETVCSFLTPFDCVNFGHNLSMIFDLIHKYRTHGLDCPIVVSTHMLKYRNAIDIIELFFDPEKIVWIEPDQIIEFSDVYVFGAHFFNILAHRAIVEECKRKAIEKAGPAPPRNVFLVKTFRDENIVSKNTAFHADKIVESLKEKGWYCPRPETTSVCEIIAHLSTAKKIVSSHGSINYAFAPFFGLDAQLYFLSLTSKRMLPYWDIQKYKMVYFQTQNLNEHADLFEAKVERSPL